MATSQSEGFRHKHSKVATLQFIDVVFSKRSHVWCLKSNGQEKEIRQIAGEQ